MYSFSHYKLKENKTGYDVLYLDCSLEEYSEEFGLLKDMDKETIEKETTRFIEEKLPELKEGVVKIMGGAVLVTTFVLGAEESTAEAAETDDAIQQKTNSDAVQEEDKLLNKADTTEEATKGNPFETEPLDIEEILTMPGGEIDIVLPKIDEIPEFNQPPMIPERIEKETKVSEEDFEWLAKMIYCEARGESLEGQIAVGAVILNRVENEQFPNNVEEVIFEQTSGTYQFSPTASGEIYSAKPDATSIEAAKRVISGEDPTNGSLFFYNPDKTNDQWIRSRTVSTVIGNHVFAF